MNIRYLSAVGAVLALVSWSPPPPAGNGAGTVVFDLISPQDGAVVPAGTNVEWRIELSVSSLDNLGLALASVDLLQAPSNPEPIAFRLGRAGGTAMRDFDRPRGFPNPGALLDESGFGGSLLDSASRLVQIGGAQNTFGVAPTCLGPNASVCMGQDTSVNAGIGQGASAQVLARGSFRAPATPGSYTVQLDSMLANTLASVNAAPQASQVRRAQVDAPTGSLTFIVQ